MVFLGLTMECGSSCGLAQLKLQRKSSPLLFCLSVPRGALLISQPQFVSFSFGTEIEDDLYL